MYPEPPAYARIARQSHPQKSPLAPLFPERRQLYKGHLLSHHSVSLGPPIGPTRPFTARTFIPLFLLTVSAAARKEDKGEGAGEDQEMSAVRQGETVKRKYKESGTEISEELHCEILGKSFNLWVPWLPYL